MSDIYYCSNAKSKKSHGSGKKSSDKAAKNSNHNNSNSHNNNNNNNNNNNFSRDNNNVCNRHTQQIEAGIADASRGAGSNWNVKAIQTTNGQRDSTTAAATTTTATTVAGPKSFHNIRCTRHQKSHNQHLNGNDDSLDTDHHHHRSHNNNNNSNSNNNGSGNGNGNISNGPRRKSDSVLSTDSDIRFTRRKLGDSQKCGCAVIAGFLVALLMAGIFVYLGYTYFRPDPLPDRVFRGKFLIVNDKWSMDLADQNSARFQHKARDYRERINLLVRRSDLREAYEGSEILALDGTEDTTDIEVHFNMVFDPYAGLVSNADLLALFAEEFNSRQRVFFANMTVDVQTLTIKEVTGLIEEPIMSSSPLGGDDETTERVVTTTARPPRRCAPVTLSYCRGATGFNLTTYPNLLGHMTPEEVQADVISFRELVDAECFREAFDFVCRLLQPPCMTHGFGVPPTAGQICREYCQAFMKGCGNRLPARFQRYFDCEVFPEATGTQSCHQKPRCAQDLQTNALSPRLCDGYADCADLSDERTCSFCTGNMLYCGRGRACVPRRSRCDGNLDCPDGSDEKDCLSIAPVAADLVNPEPLVTYLSRFYSHGYAVFSEKGVIGKLCSEGLEGDAKLVVRQTVAESLCKSLSYETVELYEIRNDTEDIGDYVRVLDPHAPEISFIRTRCPDRQVLYVGCGELQCGVQSVLSTKQHLSLPKMASPGDWPWLVALYRENVHVCDGTLISRDWILTTESCFQGQPRATWMAIFGTVRLNANAPWTQRRRIIGLIKSPVEGSTAALIRLETPVVFSDHVRPICLPDEVQRKHDKLQRRSYTPRAERLKSELSPKERISNQLAHETRQFFIAPHTTDHLDNDRFDKKQSEDLQMSNTVAYRRRRRHAGTEDPVKTEESQLDAYPLPETAPQMYNYYDQQQQQSRRTVPVSVQTPTSANKSHTPPSTATSEHTWTNCNTLGWSRQRDHLQRVQLKIADMEPCENVSIATVNSMCTEATYQKHDCTQEEYSGAPVQCLIPGTNQWALLGVSSWRIACGSPSGVERPRMYDKISSNAPWIRDTISAL